MNDLFESEFFTSDEYASTRDFIKVLLSCFILFAIITTVHKAMANDNTVQIEAKQNLTE